MWRRPRFTWVWSQDHAPWLRVSSRDWGPGEQADRGSEEAWERPQPGRRAPRRQSQKAQLLGAAPGYQLCDARRSEPRVGAMGTPTQSSAAPVPKKLRASSRRGRGQSHPPQWVAWRRPAEAVGAKAAGKTVEE